MLFNAVMETNRTLSEEQIADARRLKSLWEREFKGKISQEEAAHLCGWRTQGAFNQYLNAKIPLGLPALLKISEALGVSPEEISPRLAAKLPKKGSVDFNLSGQSYIPGSDNPPAAASSEIDLLLAKATPRSRQQLLRIAEAAADGRLSESDIKMLSDIAKRLEKGSTNHSDDYPNLKPDTADPDS
ncbi:MAG: hypothetical protein CMG91_04890 [Marinobacter sp.]|nr:hypothetical protein [Legionellales bacterium]MBI46732.1 hypothetical protein [Marinobacter sp.]MBI46792.1 hypothetical protein [Marinobacter sp.]